MSIGGGFWSSASAFARSTRHPAEMRVNFDHGCSGVREKSDYGPVDTKRDCFRRSRAPPDSFSRDNESNFFSLPT
ncbi:hypothetical protein ALC60_09902 [Trachymyrmex zeteki]|uniref:Uncharacterized protein n=1 Tax=Mycetomoellerius zeteki TaxID=64791 RepID=A0A151WT43_9HYME|nr:hypothetical protein ALC60_09902 [Trachymyrmex zeteki]